MSECVEIPYTYYSRYMVSFEDLANHTTHTDLASIVMEALAYYDFYETEVLEKFDNTLVLIKRKDKGREGCPSMPVFDSINILEHIAIGDYIYTLPEDMVSPENVEPFGQRITRALIVYETLKQGHLHDMIAGVYNSLTQTLKWLDISGVARNSSRINPPPTNTRLTPAPYRN